MDWTRPNYRLPIIAETHDPECTAGCADDPSLLDRLCSVINRATKATTGYFGGYTSKRQPVGKYGLSESARTLPLLAHKIQGDQAYKQLYRCTSRMATDNYGKGILRTMPEEFNITWRLGKLTWVPFNFISRGIGIDTARRQNSKFRLTLPPCSSYQFLRRGSRGGNRAKETFHDVSCSVDVFFEEHVCWPKSVQ